MSQFAEPYPHRPATGGRTNALRIAMERPVTVETNRLLGAIVQRLDDLKEDITEIKAQTTKTNGRVTELETINEVHAAREAERQRQRQRNLRWLIWLLGIVVAVFGSALGSIVLGVHT